MNKVGLNSLRNLAAKILNSLENDGGVYSNFQLLFHVWLWISHKTHAQKKVISQEHFHQHLSSMTPRVNPFNSTTCGAV